jgi:hypothetical protein
MMTDILGKNAASKNLVRANYSKFKPKMSGGDARLFASISFLRRFIDDTLESEKR